jgi:hypothetical protein
MNTIKSNTKKNKVVKLVEGKFYNSPVEMTNEGLSVFLPKELVSYLNIDNGKIHWVAINGVVQISGFEPNTVIPIVSLTKESFISK